MANNVEQSVYFQRRKNAGALVVRDAPKFDLESYISNYEDRTRLDRLITIGCTSTYLSIDAFHAAIAEAKQGKDTDIYMSIVGCLQQIVPEDPLSMPDLGWVEQRMKQIKAETDRLEHELKQYKNNLIKESIRMGNEDLGAHYQSIGDFNAAYKAYYKMRDYCTSPKHIADMSLKLILCSIHQRAWTTVQTHVLRIQSQSLKAEDKAKIDPILSACLGLAYMATGHYREAATAFLQTKPEFMTGNDIAVYGGLCALASMDRAELQSQVLGSSSFRNFLELEPHIRRAVSLFCGSKYSACLEILESYRTDYLLDVYLQGHVASIYGAVRRKSIVQYFIPFACVTLEEMGKAFSSGSGVPIEEELVDMIQNGTLNARIDLVNGLLLSPPSHLRQDVHDSALKMAASYEHNLRLRLLRLNMLNAGLELRAPKNLNAGVPQMHGGMEGYEEGMAGGSRLRMSRG
ncbi:hypothetical protein H2199_004174 [Coniosporium tulheliwenetii]|uniref:Uncharacterized protein n=1 Tax=Coniosporium tulheliwenetii TaxID=3383036 RepID=A0ACC2Z6V3_9PEZI|nr:hypothetical protein H2199_004174 [Cladosporium sp. JES 115]